MLALGKDSSPEATKTLYHNGREYTNRIATSSKSTLHINVIVILRILKMNDMRLCNVSPFKSKPITWKNLISEFQDILVFNPMAKLEEVNMID